MKRLYILLSAIFIFASCAKFNRSQIIGTWDVDSSLMSANDTTGIAIVTTTSEEFNEDGTIQQTITIKLNDGIISMKRNTMGFGIWKIEGDILNVHIKTQRDDDGTTRKINNIEERKLISISEHEIVYTIYNDSIHETNTFVMKKVE